ncbi:hypothetical protein [Roseateles saccharophilus]|uniref:hypothetical protein n=1 Tax=Roseateles saccharophilus TaxID=304 RepID=UPI00104FF9B9|nr:hypothetical protein [Roseateles saccharophilus]MDG0836232.1 hypothetical protein [Roseateles saccharophilus]
MFSADSQKDNTLRMEVLLNRFLSACKSTVFILIMSLSLFSHEVASADALDELRNGYPEIFSSSDLSRIVKVQNNSMIAIAAIESMVVWPINMGGISGNTSFLRLVFVKNGGSGEYYVVRESGFGMAEVSVYGPIDLQTKTPQQGKSDAQRTTTR